VSDDDEVALPRSKRKTRRALRVPVDDVPRRSAVSDLPPATAKAEAEGAAALEAPEPAAARPSSPPPPKADSTPPPKAPSAPPPKPSSPPAATSSNPPPRSSYPPPPADGKVVMAGSVRVTTGAAAEADMLDPFAEMPDAEVDPEPLASESTQVLADDDLETLDDERRSVEVRIDELDEAEAEAVLEAADEEKPASAPPPPPDDELSATDTVPGVALDELGVVDDPNDDEPELTVGEDDEPELTVGEDDEPELSAESDELDLDEAEELDDDALEDAAPPPAPPEEAKKPPKKPPEAPPAPPEAKKPPEAPPEAKKKKRRKPWFEGFFSDDYLRTVRPPTPKEVSRECDFILGQLGLPRGSTILDVGCGLGLHAIELTRRGYLVVGLDLSLPMLSRAGDEAQDEGLRINFLHGDMRQMTFEGQFDAVLCWGTTFGYFDDEGNKEVVARLLEALKPGGLLLLDIVNRDHVIADQPNLVWFEGDGCVCMEESRFDYLRSRLHVKRTVILDDGRQRENTYSLRLYAPHEIGQLLHQKGFRVTSISGMKATPGVFFGATSPELIILAERRPEPAQRSAGKVPAPPESDPSAETKPGTAAAPAEGKSKPPAEKASETADTEAGASDESAAEAKTPPPPPVTDESEEAAAAEPEVADAEADDGDAAPEVDAEDAAPEAAAEAEEADADEEVDEEPEVLEVDGDEEVDEEPEVLEVDGDEEVDEEPEVLEVDGDDDAEAEEPADEGAEAEPDEKD
jgi:SAM-dependent methyltransferase